MGRYHAGGVNVLLQRGLWESVLTNETYVVDFFPAVFRNHSYPMVWYGQTIGRPAKGTIGWRHSVEWSRLPGGDAFPPSREAWIRPGQLWWQSWADGELDLEPADANLASVPPALTATLIALGRVEQDVVTGVAEKAQSAFLAVNRARDDAMDWIDGQADRFGNWLKGKARKVGNATVEFVNDSAENIFRGVNGAIDEVQERRSAVWEASDKLTLRIRLRTGLASPSPSPRLAGKPELANTPAYLWLPVAVPADAEFLTFEFVREGAPADDALVVGFGDKPLFSLKAGFIPEKELSTSPLLDVRAWAGKTNEFFFGLTGGTSTNCMVTVENLRFYTLQPTQLTVESAGSEVILSWPSTANGQVVESASSVTAPTWSPLPQPPALFAGRFSVTKAVTGEAQFFRLRRQ